MNTKSFVIASVGAAVFFFFYGYVANVLVLGSLFADMAASPMYRPEGEEMMGLIALSCVLQAAVLGYIFLQGREGKGWMEGVRFGFLIGLFYGSWLVLMFALMPMTAVPTLADFISSTIGYMGLGAVFAALYKP